MQNSTLRFLLVLALIGVLTNAQAQSTTKTSILQQAAQVETAKQKLLQEQLQNLARLKGWDLTRREKNGGISILAGIDAGGQPLYRSTENNTIAAATIGTNKIWPGGSTGLNLNGSTATLKDKLALWDGGKVRATHAELVGRVLQKDVAPTISDHSTHVAGTMIAAGANPLAKGMSFGLQELLAYTFDNDVAEMMTAAPGLLVSNHSYGYNAGWNFNEAQNRWEFLGQAGATEDYKFGYYSDQAQVWDSIAYNAPYYLIVKSAGNNRDINGPAVGQPYWRYNASNVLINAGARPAGISDNDSYDILSLNSTAKNILLVGAINPIPGGWGKSQDVVMSSFSSWGPTDDGRIKPDIVADGVNLLSCIGTADNAYASFSGTSMSSPNASGSIFLLQEYYAQLHAGTFMRAATLKGLVIHTADEAGAAPGPDYQFGWGLINMERAAAVITTGNSSSIIQENNLDNGGSLSLPVIASGNGILSATISWTDPKADVVPFAQALNNTSPRLVNDLDIVIKHGSTTYKPWILNPATPGAAATTGDNVLDNVEKIEIPDAIPGETYTLEITHKNTLQRNAQAYSLIVTGAGGLAYCASNPTSTGGARIDSVSIGNIQHKTAAGCTSYSNFTTLTANLQPGQALPLFIHLNSCDATNVSKIVKAYIDANNDGDFIDAGENVATSAVINGDGDFAGTVTVPSNLSIGKYSILRLVMEETNTAAVINPCGTYTKGETQDFRIFIASPSSDLGITGVVSPQTGSCPSGEQYLTVTIRNFGTADKTGVPLTATVKQGATTIATLTANYPATITSLSELDYTFQTPFILTAGLNYTVTASTGLAGDQNAVNNQLTYAFTAAPAGATPAGTAEICGNTGLLKVVSASPNANYFWYNAVAATASIATGTSVQTADIPANKTYYLASGLEGKVGLSSKNVYPIPGGGYQANGGNYLKYSSTVPVLLEHVKLFTKYPGTVTITAADIGTITGNTYTYSPLAVKTFEVYATNPNPSPGAQDAVAADAADLGAVFNVDLLLPAGNHVLITTTSGATIFRNNNVTGSPYPFSIPNLISITGNNATLAGNTNYFQGFYYYLYDLKVRTLGCTSDRAAILATTAVPPIISLTGNELSSNAATGNQWYLNNVLIIGATNQTFTAVADGIYTVQVTDAAGCALASNEINFATTPVTTVDPSQIGLIVSPNPARGKQFNLQLETNTRADLRVSLQNNAGQRVYGFSIPAFTGKLTRLINPGGLASGIYYLEVIHDNKRYLRKILLTE